MGHPIYIYMMLCQMRWELIRKGEFDGVEGTTQLLKDKSSCPSLPQDSGQMKHYTPENNISSLGVYVGILGSP